MSGISEDVGKLGSIIASMKNGIELGDPIETLEWCAAEIRRLRAENKELRDSYERVDRALRDRQAMPG